MKSKLFFFVLGVSFVLFAAAQNRKASGSTSKVLIGFSFSPDYNYRRLHNTSGSATADMVIAARNGVETGRIGYTAGAGFLYQISQKLSLETGLHYSSKGYRTRTNGLVTNFPDPVAPEKLQVVHAFRYLDVPLKAVITHGSNDLSFFWSLGATANFFLNEKVKQKVTYADGNTVRTSATYTEGINSFGISPTVSIGLAGSVDRNIFFRVEPTFRYGLSKVSETPVTAYFWNAGINLGLYKRIR